jgi:hypothetical protein
LGKLVAVGSDIYYGKRGFTIDVADQGEYFAALSSLARQDDLLKLNDDQKHLAQLFHFVLHFTMQWPYPYDKPSGLVLNPPQDMLRSKAIDLYLPTLDAMTLTSAEWDLCMGSFLCPNGSNHIPVPNWKHKSEPNFSLSLETR